MSVTGRAKREIMTPQIFWWRVIVSWLKIEAGKTPEPIKEREINESKGAADH
jgi:hypothetical protein